MVLDMLWHMNPVLDMAEAFRSVSHHWRRQRAVSGTLGTRSTRWRRAIQLIVTWLRAIVMRTMKRLSYWTMSLRQHLIRPNIRCSHGRSCWETWGGGGSRNEILGEQEDGGTLYVRNPFSSNYVCGVVFFFFFHFIQLCGTSRDCLASLSLLSINFC